MTDIASVAATTRVLTDDPLGGTPDAAAAHLITDEARGLCPNCETRLQGAYCHACGQKAHLHNRLRDLLMEAIEGIAHFDGRLWRTLPLLAFNPGRLSREWRAGRRVRYIAPLHLFLFAVFLFFLVPTLSGRHLISLPSPEQVNASAAMQRATAEARAAQGAAVQDPRRRITVDETTDSGRRIGRALRERFDNRDYYGYRIESLAYKLSFVLVPISMLILALLMAFRRGYSFYDHGVVSLYGIGFLALVVTVITIVQAIIAAMGFGLTSLAAGIAMTGFAAHAICHLRGAYNLSWPGAVIRGLLLCGFSAIGFGLFMIAVILLGLFG